MGGVFIELSQELPIKSIECYGMWFWQFDKLCYVMLMTICTIERNWEINELTKNTLPEWHFSLSNQQQMQQFLPIDYSQGPNRIQEVVFCPDDLIISDLQNYVSPV